MKKKEKKNHYGTTIHVNKYSARLNLGYRGEAALLAPGAPDDRGVTLAVCDFDMRFTYILAGWEGSAHDTAVWRDAHYYKGFKTPPGSTGLETLAM